MCEYCPECHERYEVNRPSLSSRLLPPSGEARIYERLNECELDFVEDLKKKKKSDLLTAILFVKYSSCLVSLIDLQSSPVVWAGQLHQPILQ